jgi:hypothetical protein
MPCMATDITYLGTTNWRNRNIPFGIRDKDRLRHIYALGKTGSGKSTLLLNLAISDIQRGNPLCVIDPHGDLCEELLRHVPKERINDVIYFNPADLEYPIAFNLLRNVQPQYHDLIASGLMSAFKKIWEDAWGNRTAHILRFSLLTLLEYGEGTIMDIQKLLTDQSWRNFVLLKVKNPDVQKFWSKEYNAHTKAGQAVIISPILNKMGVFASSQPLRAMFGQKERSFSMQEVMDNNKILIVNLSKGLIGEDTCAFIGCMIVSSIQSAALYRARQPEHTRKNFYLYIDECHTFVTGSFVGILAEARKYGLSLFMCNQYIDQLKDEIWSGIRGNIGTLISFTVGATDAQYLAREFAPVFNEQDIISLPRYSMYVKLMIDGTISRPFSADSLPPKESQPDFTKEIIAVSRSTYGRPAAA